MPPNSAKQKYRSHGSLKVAGWRVKPLVTVADLLHTLSPHHCVCSYPTLLFGNLQEIYSTPPTKKKALALSSFKMAQTKKDISRTTRMYLICEVSVVGRTYIFKFMATCHGA